MFFRAEWVSSIKAATSQNKRQFFHRDDFCVIGENFKNCFSAQRRQLLRCAKRLCNIGLLCYEKTNKYENMGTLVPKKFKEETFSLQEGYLALDLLLLDNKLLVRL